jgi:hypothetical protein
LVIFAAKRARLPRLFWQKVHSEKSLKKLKKVLDKGEEMW